MVFKLIDTWEEEGRTLSETYECLDCGFTITCSGEGDSPCNCPCEFYEVDDE